MKIESFIVDIQGGTIYFKSKAHNRLFKAFLRQFQGIHELKIEKRKSKRTEEQNRYYWFYLGVVAEERGHTKDEIHDWAKGRFLTKEIKEIFGHKVRIIGSTTEVSKGAFVEYLMNIEAETGVPLPDTTEYFGYSYHK